MRPAAGMSRTIIASLVLFLALTGCKKNDEQKETGGPTAPVSVLSAPAEISAQESQQTLPSGAMKGLSVHTVPSVAQTEELPDMVTIEGTDISVRMSHRMRTLPGWTQKFPQFYKAVNDCLMQIDGGAAYASDVSDNDDGMVRAVVTGLDNHAYVCVIPAAGGKAANLREIETAPTGQILFYPRSGGRPFVDNPACYEMEAVVARPGGLIGWIAFHKSSCALAPAQPVTP